MDVGTVCSGVQRNQLVMQPPNKQFVLPLGTGPHAPTSAQPCAKLDWELHVARRGIHINTHKNRSKLCNSVREVASDKILVKRSSSPRWQYGKEESHSQHFTAT
jgi:hypothetical protein